MLLAFETAVLARTQINIGKFNTFYLCDIKCFYFNFATHDCTFYSIIISFEVQKSINVDSCGKKVRNCYKIFIIPRSVAVF